MKTFVMSEGRCTIPTIVNVPHQPRVLLVIATLGKRPAYLQQTISSIRSQSVASDIIIVAPVQAPDIQQRAQRAQATLLPDPGSLTAAINLGISHGLTQHEYAYVNWLNDDDLLEPESLAATTQLLDETPAAVVAYGSCRYIDESGDEILISKAGPWASRLLSWGPDLIPQPGMLVRARAWQEVGGLDESYQLAFDLDLLLKLKKIGRLIDTGTVVSSFRWHAESLTVDDRTKNIEESERAKRNQLGAFARNLAWIWEGPVRVATRVAAREVQRRALRTGS
jgi:GT2 family glycosyltransferase